MSSEYLYQARPITARAGTESTVTNIRYKDNH